MLFRTLYVSFVKTVGAIFFPHNHLITRHTYEHTRFCLVSRLFGAIVVIHVDKTREFSRKNHRRVITRAPLVSHRARVKKWREMRLVAGMTY